MRAVPNPTWAGSLVLTKSGGVRVFDAATQGSEITFNGSDNVFESSTLPRSLFVEGSGESASMRDVTLTLASQSSAADSDSVKFTVLWVEPIDVAFFGTVSIDNDKREAYRAMTESDTYDLGLQKFVNPDLWGWGTEARGTVHPSQFEYPLIDVRLDRDWEVRMFEGNGNPMGDPKDFSPSIPPGNDTSPAANRDDDPTDSDPFGAIYDWDSPGLFRDQAPANEVRRYRANFKAFATAPLPEDFVRASLIRTYFVRISMKQINVPSGANWVLVDDVAGDNQAGYGTTALTWNLQ